MDTNKVVARLQKRLSKFFAEWVANETCIEMFRDDPQSYFSLYVDGEKKARLLGIRADESFTWRFNQYANSALHEQWSWGDFALSARYAHAVVGFESGMVPNVTPLLEYSAALFLSLNIIAGWKDRADQVGAMLYRGLDTRLLDLLLNERHQSGTLFRHFWFLMHLYCDAKGLELDTSKYSYPEDMSPYAEVLADWRTPDLVKVQAFVSAMADFHVQEARTTAHDEIAEFDTEDRMLFPYEILAFLRMREWQGLTNPEVFEHPLMQQPLAKQPKDVPLAVPETPLLDQVVVKFQQEYPGSFS